MHAPDNLEFFVTPSWDFSIHTHWHSAVRCSISQWVLPTYVCACGHYWWFVDNEHCWQLSATGALTNTANEHCWQLSVLVNTADSCLSYGNTADSCLSLPTLQTVVCLWECCSQLPLQTLLMFVCPCEHCWQLSVLWEHCKQLSVLVNTADSCLSLWTLLTVVCPMGTLQTVVCPCEHCWQLSVPWEHCWCLSVLVNTANLCLSLWALLTVICCWECCSLLPL